MVRSFALDQAASVIYLFPTSASPVELDVMSLRPPLPITTMTSRAFGTECSGGVSPATQLVPGEVCSGKCADAGQMAFSNCLFSLCVSVCLCESFPSTLGRNTYRFKSMPRGPTELHFCFSSFIWAVFLTAVTDYFRGCNNVDGADGAANGFFFFFFLSKRHIFPLLPTDSKNHQGDSTSAARPPHVCHVAAFKKRQKKKQSFVTLR